MVAFPSITLMPQFAVFIPSQTYLSPSLEANALMVLSLIVTSETLVPTPIVWLPSTSTMLFPIKALLAATSIPTT